MITMHTKGYVDYTSLDFNGSPVIKELETTAYYISFEFSASHRMTFVIDWAILPIFGRSDGRKIVLGDMKYDSDINPKTVTAVSLKTKSFDGLYKGHPIPYTDSIETHTINMSNVLMVKCWETPRNEDNRPNWVSRCMIQPLIYG